MGVLMRLSARYVLSGVLKPCTSILPFLSLHMAIQFNAWRGYENHNSSISDIKSEVLCGWWQFTPRILTVWNVGPDWMWWLVWKQGGGWVQWLCSYKERVCATKSGWRSLPSAPTFSIDSKFRHNKVHRAVVHQQRFESNIWYIRLSTSWVFSLA